MADARVGLSREETLERVRARILGYARRRLSPADAEDLTQEALGVLATKYAQVSALEEVTALGVRIVAFKRSAFWRKLERRRAAGEASPPDGPDDAPLEAASDTPDPEELARTRQRVAMLVEAAAHLEGRCREIWRRKLEGSSFVEIAAELGRPVNTVYSWDYRCHQRLKAILVESWAYVTGEAT